MLVVVLVTVFVLLLALAAAAAFVLARRRYQRQASAEWVRWEETARTLSWRDRFELLQATTRGRAVSKPELAPLARQRSEAAIAVIENIDATPWSQWRLALTAFVVGSGVANIAIGLITRDVTGLCQGLALVAVGACVSPPAQRRTNERLLERLRRSAQVNAEAGTHG